MSNPKKFGIAFAGLIGLALLLYSGEKLRGESAWKAFKQKWEAKGVSFNFRDSIPPAVPTEKNFAHTPLLKSLPFQESNTGNTNAAKDPAQRATQLMALEGEPPSLGQWRLGKRVDLGKWQKYFQSQKDWPQPAEAGKPGADILHALKKHEKEFTELASAMRERPRCRFDLQYEETFHMKMPHLQVIRNAARGSVLRSLAHLAEDQPDEALMDLELTLHLSECLAHEPVLISQLVRIVIQEMALQILWEGLAEQQWKAKHLSTLEPQLAAINTLAGFETAMTLERNGANHLMDQMLESDESVWKQIEALGGEIPNAWLRLAPKGWVYQNLVNLNRMHLDYTHKLIDSKARRVYSKVAGEFERAVNEMKPGPYNLLPSLFLPALNTIASRVGASQSSVDLALLAVRLEQHRLQHDTFPKALSELQGTQPNDLFSGKAYSYHPNDGRYELRGVGWNNKDDQGNVVIKKYGNEVQLTDGDLVWKYPKPIQ